MYVHVCTTYIYFREEMTELIEKNAFIEHAQFSGNMYGTSKQAVQHVLNSGTI